jgi:protein-L-isoaspartate(D-aspartate) O-methyltransferase
MKFNQNKIRFALRFLTGILFVMILTSGRCSNQNNKEEKENANSGIEVKFSQTDWRKEAKEMVDHQIRSRNVSNKSVLKVMEETPRHNFVPDSYRRYAYTDQPLPIGEGQTISQPYIVALMTELLELQGDEKVLEIGTGSGYQAAILSQLTREVYTIEIVEPLYDLSTAILAQMGFDNVKVKLGDGYQGWIEHAPFDAIIITAAPPEIPPKLIEQLKPGGKMVLPVGTVTQELKVVTKTLDGKIMERTEIGVRFVPMVHPKDSLKKNR